MSWLGAFESGLAASALGSLIVAGGLMTLLVVAIIVDAAPKLRQLHINDLL